MGIMNSCWLSAQFAGDVDSLIETIELEDVVITAQYAPTASENAVFPVKVIRQEDIQKQGAINISEVLQNQLNLQISPDPILGDGLRIQGLGGQNVQILIDGVPMIGRLNGNIDLTQINVSSIKRIELVQGSMATTYGSNASGGVINILTKDTQLDKFDFRTENQYETVGITNHSASMGYQNNKLFVGVDGYYTRSEIGDQDSLRSLRTIELGDGSTARIRVNPWNPKTQMGLSGTARYRLSDSSDMKYQYRWFDEYLINYGEKRRPQFRPYAFDEHFTTHRNDHSLQITHYLKPRLYLSSTTGWNAFMRTSETQRVDFEKDSTSVVPSQNDTTDFRSFLHRSSLSYTGKGFLSAQLGAEYLREEGSGGRILDTNAIEENSSVIRTAAIWSSIKLKPAENFKAQIDMRWATSSKYEPPLIPALHLQWRLFNDIDIKASYAEGFRAPTIKELHFNFIDINHFIVGNPELKPESSRNISLSIENKKLYHQKNLSVGTSARLFHNSIQERIILAEYSPLKFTYSNLESFYTYGMNLGLSVRVKEALRWNIGYSHTKIYNQLSSEFDSDKFIGLNEVQNNLSYDWSLTRLNFTLNHRFIGNQIRFGVDEQGAISQGSIEDYHLLNLAVNRSFLDDQIVLSIGAKNLLDVTAVNTTGADNSIHSSSTATQLVGWGRSYFVRLSVKL